VNPLSLSLPVLLAVLLGVAILGLLIFVVLQLVGLFRSSCAEGLVNHCLLGFWKAQRRLREKGKARAANRRRGGKPKSPFSIIDFPVTLVALVLLCTVVLTVGLVNWKFVQSSATFSFSASFDRANPAVATSNTAAPSVGMTIEAVGVLEPSGEELSDAAVVVTGPGTVAFRACYGKVQGRVSKGYASGSQARIELGDLDSSGAVEVKCEIFIEHRIRHLETVQFELTAANSADGSEKFLYLVPPDVKQGQETAEAQADEEIRTSPALWERSSMVATKDGFEEQGEVWPLIDPRYLHGFAAGPKGRPTTLHHLQDTRVEPSKIVTLDAVITSHPVTQERFEAKGSERRAVRQVFAVGQEPGEKAGWCTTTRSTAQVPLREGRHVRLRAVVVEWGRSEASGGIAVMLTCPAVRILGATGAPARAFDLGAAVVPDRLSHRVR